MFVKVYFNTFYPHIFYSRTSISLFAQQCLLLKKTFKSVGDFHDLLESQAYAYIIIILLAILDLFILFYLKTYTPTPAQKTAGSLGASSVACSHSV